MSTAKNDITGDFIISKTNTDAYRENWEVIFGNKKDESKEVEDCRCIECVCKEEN